MVWPVASSAALITSSPATVLMMTPQHGFHVHGVRGAGAVADAVRRGGRHGVKRFTQLPHLARRNGCGPLAIGVHRGAVRFAVEHHGDHRARCQPGSRTCDGQILRFLAAVDYIVTGHGVNGQHRRGEVDFNLVRCAVAVSGFIGQRRGDGVIPGGGALTSAAGTPTLHLPEVSVVAV